MLRYIFILLSLLVISCQSPERTTPELLPQTLLKPRYAKGFEVRTDGTNYQLVTYTPGSSQQIHRVISLRFPVDVFACGSTTQLSFFQCIGEIQRVKACSYAHLVRDSALVARVDEGQILNLTTSEDLDREVLLGVHPQVLLTVPFSPVDEGALERSGIQCIPLAEYLEDHPLGRAEWVRLIGLLCGKSSQADSVFAGIEERYLAIVNSLNGLSGKDNRVLFSSNESGEWFAPPGNSVISRLITDAGATYLFADSISGRGNIVLTKEHLIGIADRADWWGDMIHFEGMYTRELAGRSVPGSAEMPAFREGRLFHCNSASSDYFGKALVEPDILLADLAAIFHPEQYDGHRPVYFFPTR